MKAPSWFLLATFVFSGCGYSQDEWDQKVRENEELRAQLSSEQRARAKSESDYADALEEIDSLRNQVMEGGLSLDSMNANLEAQKKALEEYAQRTAQLQQIRERFDILKGKLAQLTKLGLKLEVRDNRMVIELPGDVLFDSGKDELKKDGQAILLKIAEVVRSDVDLRKRHFQVAGHTDDRPFVGGNFKDNWGLSAMRARSVLVLLTTALDKKGGGLDVRNWSAAGYGSTDPVADNTSDEGRAKNRRVELVAQPDVNEMINLGSIDSGNP
ncbi:MAG TPA: OmpA family protein [Polyangiaceae bacterium]|nr:OmpA family protein [Polyangiaceae bacterium]